MEGGEVSCSVISNEDSEMSCFNKYKWKMNGDRGVPGGD